ncbi:MAG: hypothetical protein PHQ60_02285 [Sideroxydans sp.]|nr:hypothetical protein [Sideroxydans sp.]MDD5056672.1 hypothetical protein [Sideroxydans sp.]
MIGEIQIHILSVLPRSAVVFPINICALPPSWTAQPVRFWRQSRLTQRQLVKASRSAYIWRKPARIRRSLFTSGNARFERPEQVYRGGSVKANQSHGFIVAGCSVFFKRGANIEIARKLGGDNKKPSHLSEVGRLRYCF